MLKKNPAPIVKVDEKMLMDELQLEYKQKGRDFLTTSSLLAKKLNGSVYVVREILMNFEEKDIMERTELSRGKIIWRTSFGKKQR